MGKECSVSIRKSDINYKVIESGGEVLDSSKIKSFGLPVVSNEDFKQFNDIYSKVKREKQECILFNLVNQWPQEPIPIIDGFFARLDEVSDTGTTAITKSTVVLVAYLDFKAPLKDSVIIEGKLFECRKPDDPLATVRINDGR